MVTIINKAFKFEHKQRSVTSTAIHDGNLGQIYLNFRLLTARGDPALPFWSRLVRALWRDSIISSVPSRRNLAKKISFRFLEWKSNFWLTRAPSKESKCKPFKISSRNKIRRKKTRTVVFCLESLALNVIFSIKICWPIYGEIRPICKLTIRLGKMRMQFFKFLLDSGRRTDED